MTFTVYIDDNFHFSTDDERCFDSTHETAEAAIDRCRQIVEADLRSILAQGYPPGDLYATWSIFGDSPFVPGHGFSARGYAEEWCGGLLARQ